MSVFSPSDAPMPLAPRARHLLSAGGGAAWSLADEALLRARAGADVLLLTLGDPAPPPHPDIVAATNRALAAGRTHYPPLLGEPDLRAAIAAHCAVDPQLVVVTPGAQHGALAAIGLVAGEGDEVILQDPYYTTYPGVVAAAGAMAVPVPCRMDLATDTQAIAAAITPRTRAILLNSPANPTGQALDEADYRHLSALCAAHDIWLIVDEVYASFTFTGRHVSALRHGPPGRTIVINSFSKSHAMSGYRLGWLVAPAPVVEALAAWNAAALFGVSQFIQDAGTAALALPQSELADYRSGFAKRARHLVDRIATIPGLSVQMPAGGMFLMVDCRDIDADDVRFARRLLDEAGVATMPGSGFGACGAGHVRISLTPDRDMLDRAFDRIERLLRAA